MGGVGTQNPNPPVAVVKAKPTLESLDSKIEVLKELLSDGNLSQEAYDHKVGEIEAEKKEMENEAANATVNLAMDTTAGKGGEVKEQKEQKRKRKTFTEVANFVEKAEAIAWLQADGRCFKRINSSKSYKGGPLGAIYKCNLFKDGDYMVRLWFDRAKEHWVISESGTKGTEYNIVQGRISPFLKQKLIPMLKEEDGRPVKVLDQIKKEAETSGDESLQKMIEQVTYKQVAALRRGIKPKEEKKELEAATGVPLMED